MVLTVQKAIPMAEFIEKTKNKEIQVDLGDLWLDFPEENRLLHIVHELERIHRRDLEILSKKEDEKYMNILKEINGPYSPSDLKVLEDGQVMTRSLDNIAIHSWITGERHFLVFDLEKNLIQFRDLDYDACNKIPMDVPDYWEQRKQCLVPPKVNSDIKEPIKASIQIPSGHIVFANYLSYPDEDRKDRSSAFNPCPENQYSDEFSLNSLIGRRNLTQYYATNNNVAYGQMGNMSMAIYANENECIITTSCLDDAEGMSDNYAGGIIEVRKLRKYIKNASLEFKGQISLSVWRWEAADYERAKPCMVDKGHGAGAPTINSKGYLSDYIHFPVAGKTAHFEHYYDGIATSCISASIYSHFWFI